MQKRILAGMLSLAISVVSPLAFAGGVVAGATEITQIMNNAQLSASYAEAAQQTATQMQQYQAMLKHLQQITPSSMLDQAAQKLFVDQNMLNAFKNLQKVIVAGEQTAYTMQNVEQKFKQLNKGYGGYANGIDIAQSLKGWSDNTLGAVKNSLALVTAHSENFASEQGMMSELQMRSQTAQGQLQATQAGSQISLAMIGQMQKLQQLQMAQMQAQNAHIMAQQGEKDTDAAALKAVYGNLQSKRLK